MKVYLVSLAVGVLVGVIYALLNVRSPAPPIVALVGLLGILIGEQVPPLIVQLWEKQSVTHSWIRQVQPHVFVRLPEGQGLSSVEAGELGHNARSAERVS